MTHILFQFNISYMIAPFTDAIFDDFRAQLKELHALADSDSNFRWRYKGENDEHGYVMPYSKRPLTLGNLSAWNSYESLFNFTFTKEHLEILKDKRKWFKKPPERYGVLYYLHKAWLQQSDTCLIETAKLRLKHYRENGPSYLGFGFGEHLDEL